MRLCLWLGLAFRRGRPTLDRSPGHNRSLGLNSRHGHIRRLGYSRSLGDNRSLGHNGSLDYNRSLGYNGLAALPFASANFQSKTGHANQSNWHIAIFGHPLSQQTARPHVRLFERYPRSPLHRQEKCGETKFARLPFRVLPVIIYRQIALAVPDSHDLIL